MTTAYAFYTVGAITMTSAVFALLYSEKKPLALGYAIVLIFIGSTVVASTPNENLWYRLFHY